MGKFQIFSNKNAIKSVFLGGQVRVVFTFFPSSLFPTLLFPTSTISQLAGRETSFLAFSGLLIPACTASWLQ